MILSSPEYSKADKTRVRVLVDGGRWVDIPCDSRNAVYKELRSKVDAGRLSIAAYQPPPEHPSNV